MTGLLGWTLSRPEVFGDTALIPALHLLTFLIGGPGHVVALGALIAGIAASGYLPRTHRDRRTPRTGALVLAWTALGPILPVARLAALAWLLVPAHACRRAAVTRPRRPDLAVLSTLARSYAPADIAVAWM